MKDPFDKKFDRFFGFALVAGVLSSLFTAAVIVTLLVILWKAVS